MIFTPGSFNLLTRGPSIARSAGSNVNAVIITTSRLMLVEIATVRMYSTPTRNRPITAMTTVQPATSTLRPAVVSASVKAAFVSP